MLYVKASAANMAGAWFIQYSSIAVNELFVLSTNNKGTRGHSCKLKKVRCTRDIVRHFFEQSY